MLAGKMPPPQVSYDFMIQGDADRSTLNTLKKKVGQFATRTNRHYFVGKACGSNPPEKRWSQKYKPPPRNYTMMYVLCQTPSEDEALWLEDELIRYFKDTKIGRFIDNPVAGGAGRRGSGVGFVYLVLK